MSLSLLALVALAVPPQVAEPEWTLIKPSTTGIPGSQPFWAHFDPEGDLWVSARHPFWFEGGVARFDGLQWETFSNVDTPMPSDSVPSVAFDADGSQWFGTSEGLVHKDGDAYTIYDSSNTPLPVHQIESLRFDAQGRLWMVYRHVGLAAQGVARFDGTNWALWPHTEIGFEISHQLSNLAIDAAGDVWVGTAYAGGIARLRGGTWTVYDDIGPWANWPATMLTLGGDGHLWCNWNGLRKFDGQQWIKVQDSPVQAAYSALAVPGDGSYWVGTFSGLLQRKDATGWKSWVYGNHLYSIDFDPKTGAPWASGLAGTRRLEPDGSWTNYISGNTGLPEYFTDAIAFHPDGHAWFAQSGAGASTFDGRTWRAFHPKNQGFEPWPFPTDTAEDVEIAPNGDVWVQLGPAGVGQWNGTAWTQHLGIHWIDALGMSSDGRPWAGLVNDQLARWNGSSWVLVPTPGFTQVNEIIGAPGGVMWIASINGLGRWENGSWTLYEQAPGKLPSNWVFDVGVHPDGSVWVGTDQGLVRFDGTTWTNHTAGLPVDVVSEIEIAPDGTVWVGAFDGQTWPYQGGVGRLQDGEWTVWTRENSPLPHEQISALALDPWGNAWVGAQSEGVAVIHVGSEPFPSIWERVGPALPGWSGTPDLVGDGLLDAGETLVLRLADAVPSAPGYFVLGFSQALVPLFDGVLVPAPAVLVPTATDAKGEARLELPLAAPLPSGLTVVAQAWLLDPAAAHGVAASNGVVSASAR